MQNKNDTIYRQAAIDALCNIGEHNSLGVEEIKKSLTVEPEQQNTRIFQGIVVEYPSISTYPEYEGKPYFSIKYTEDGQDFIGYGTYKPDILSEYLKKYFMPPAQPRMRGKWKEDKDCPNLAYLCSECGYFTTTRTDFCPGCGADMRLRGIYQPKYIEYICKYGDGRCKMNNRKIIYLDDAIDAIRASALKYTGFMGMEMYTDDDAVEALEALPSAEPE